MWAITVWSFNILVSLLTMGATKWAGAADKASSIHDEVLDPQGLIW